MTNVTNLRSGRDAVRVTWRLAIRAGQAAAEAGAPRYPEPYTDPVARAAYRDGWNSTVRAAR